MVSVGPIAASRLRGTSSVSAAISRNTVKSASRWRGNRNIPDCESKGRGDMRDKRSFNRISQR